MTTTTYLTPPTLDDIIAAREVVYQYLKPTPVLRPPALSADLGFDVVLKCENLQPMGAFKIRGGVYFMSRMTDEERSRGVVTASSGNHGLSIAYAAELFGVPAVIILPENPNPVKKAAIERMGATVIEVSTEGDGLMQAAEEYAEEHNMFFVHPIQNALLYHAVGSYALELIEEEPELDVVIVPVGGGSGVCSTATVFKSMRPQTKIIAAQSRNKPAVFEAFHRRQIMRVPGEYTRAEGLATDTAYELPFGIMQELVDDVVLVDDEDLRQAMLTLLEQAHIAAEPSGAAALAAACNMKDELTGQKVGIVISGGNVPLETLKSALTDAPW